MTPDYIGDVSGMLRAAIVRRDAQSALLVIQAVAADGHRELADQMTRQLIAAGIDRLATPSR